MNFEDLLHKSPRILEVLPSKALQALLATSSKVRREVHDFTTGITTRGDVSDAVDILIRNSFPRLKRLSASDPCYLATHIAQLASLGWSTLQHLQLCVSLSGEELTAFLDNVHLPALQSLDLSHNKFDQQAVMSLTGCKLPRLGHLVLREAALDASAIAQLVNGHWPQLSSLELAGNDFADKGLQSVSKADWPLLSKLDISVSAARNSSSRLEHCLAPRFHAAAVAYLAQSNFPLLNVLVINENLMGAETIEQLSKVCWPHLKYLSLRHNNLDDIAIEWLAEANWPILEHLDLYCNSLDNAAIAQLVQCNWPCLQTLELGRNQFEGDAMRILARGEWPLLQELGLANVVWTSADLSKLFLGEWPLLEKLDASGLFMSDDVVTLLFGVMSVNELHAQQEHAMTGRQLSLADCPVCHHWPKLQSIHITIRVPSTYMGAQLSVKCV